MIKLKIIFLEQKKIVFAKIILMIWIINIKYKLSKMIYYILMILDMILSKKTYQWNINKYKMEYKLNFQKIKIYNKNHT